jgi:hypothetical protein
VAVWAIAKKGRASKNSAENSFLLTRAAMPDKWLFFIYANYGFSGANLRISCLIQAKNKKF